MSNALLLAEPEAATRGFLEHHLRQDGFDVVEARDGDAVALLELTRPDLVLASDSLAADLCRRAADVPVIVLGAADSDPVDRVRAFDGGCDDYVPRPFHYEELLGGFSYFLDPDIAYFQGCFGRPLSLRMPESPVRGMTFVTLPGQRAASAPIHKRRQGPKPLMAFVSVSRSGLR